MKILKYIIISVVIALILISTFPYFRVFCHTVVDTFSVGRSDSKTFLFLIFGLVVSATTYFLYFKNKKFSSHYVSKIKKVTLSFVTFSFLYNLALYSYFIISNNLNPLNLYSIYRNGEVTAMLFLHNHMSKGYIAVINKYLNIDTGDVDSGKALIGIFPDIVFLIGAIFTIFTIVFVIYLVSIKVKEFDFKGYKGVFGSLGVFMSAFLLLKGIIDGGFLSIEAVIGLVFFLVFIYKDNLFKKIAIVYLSVYIVLLDALYLHNYIDETQLASKILILFSLTVLLVSFYCFAHEGKNRKNFLLLLLALIPFINQIYSNFSVFEYLSREINVGESAYLISRNNLTSNNFLLQGQYGDVGLYEWLGDKKVNIYNLIEKTGFVYSIAPVISPWVDCVPVGEISRYKTNIFTFEPLSEGVFSDDNYYLKINEDSVKDGVYKYKINFYSKPCTSLGLVEIFHALISRKTNFFFSENLEKIEQ